MGLCWVPRNAQLFLMTMNWVNNMYIKPQHYTRYLQNSNSRASLYGILIIGLKGALYSNTHALLWNAIIKPHYLIKTVGFAITT